MAEATHNTAPFKAADQVFAAIASMVEQKHGDEATLGAAAVEPEAQMPHGERDKTETAPTTIP